MECCICNNIREANIVIGGANICDKCEDRLINTKAEDSAYDFYKNRIKEILVSMSVQSRVNYIY